jgi:acyl-CoA thioester hydrolase
MFRFETQVRVRYAETDKMGVVYYGNYATYYEVARVEALRSLGITYKLMEDSGMIMPVLENYSKYIMPAQYDDLLTVVLILKEKPSTRMRFDYEIYNEGKKLINLGYSTLVFVDLKTGKPAEAPADIVDVLKPFFNGI